MNSEIEQIAQAIAALEQQRALLGDAVVDTALAPLRAKLAALHQAQTTQPQRKIISVLFADLSNFTALSETLDAEDVALVVNQLWERVDRILEAHGGEIDKHIGDAVMALWGATAGREDDAEQAIRAALAVQAALQNWRQQADNPLVGRLNLRIGISSGPVLLSAMGSKHEYTAMGDTVNLAARLLEVAGPGEIYIAHPTYRYVRGLFEVKARPPVRLKGKSDEVQTYLVKDAKPRAFHLQTRGVEGIETRMIGRAEELAFLKRTLQEVLAQSAWQAVTVLAEAGVGKSRLLYEFNTWTELQPRQWRLFKGRADETMTRSPYALWRDVFSFRFDIQNSDPRELACAKLEQGVGKLLESDPRSQEIAHLLGYLIGLGFPDSPHLQPLLGNPAQIQAQTRAALLYLLRVAAAHSPVALQLEDIHWADDGSLELLEYLFNTLPAETQLVGIFLARPTLLERRPEWGSQPNHHRLSLSPLSAEESAQLAGDILQKIPHPLPELQRRIAEHAAGNPFYLEELIKMLIDKGVIIPGEESWSVDESRLDLAQAPATLTGILQARLDSLSRSERLALQRAAILGQVFWDDAVRHLARITAESLPIGTLSMVQKKELIYSRQPPAFTGAREFGFKHAILRDVTYDTVLKRDRPGLHALAADWLAQRSGERVNEFAALIAEHYEKAGDFLQAAQYLNRVAQRAHSISAYDESLAALERIINLLGNDARPEAQKLLLTARVRIGEIYGRGRDAYAEARLHLEAALELARRSQDALNEAAALGQLGWVKFCQGDADGAAACYSQAMPLVRALGDKRQEIYLARQVGNVAYSRGNLAEARRYFTESLALAQTAGMIDGEAHAQASLGLVELQEGQPEKAERQLQLGLQLFRQLGERRYIAVALINLSNICFSLKRYAESRQHAQEALRLAQQIGSVQSTSSAIRLLAQVDLREGHLDTAREHLQESAALSQAIGETPDVLECLTLFSEWLAARGDSDAATRVVQMAATHPVSNSEIQQSIQEISKTYSLNLDANLPALSLEEALELLRRPS